MRLKLDENLGRRGADALVAGGHDVATVVEEKSSGADDEQIIAACQHEHRCLVTLDLDFSNPLLFPPWEYSGIAVLRLPRKATAEELIAACRTLVQGLERSEITGRLWIVELGRIREYQPNQDR